MSKKKLSDLELKLKKVAVLANDKFATKEEQSEAVATLNTAIENATLIPVDVSAMTPITVFPKNSVIGINGVLYRASSYTSKLPFDMVVQDGAFVTVEVGGIDVFIIADNTLNSPWKPWTDSSIPAHLSDLDQRMAAIETMNWNGRITSLENINAQSRLVALEAQTQSVTYNGHTYTLQQIMAQVVKLMETTVIIEQTEE